MLSALVLGLLWDGAASYAESLIFPALAVIMTIAVMGIRKDALGSPGKFVAYGSAGIAMTYAVHGSFLLALSHLFIQDHALWSGFVLLAAVPPAVAVIPFAVFLKGNTSVALMGTVGAYLSALLIAPVVVLIFLGATVLSPTKILIVIAELIVLPVLLARLLTWTGTARFLTPIRGDVTNWSFFIITYTIVGLNQKVFTSQPLSLIPVVLISFAATFLLGWVIEFSARRLRLNWDTTVSIVLLGTLKNYGLSGGLALSFFDQRAAIPSTVSVVFMILYIIWLDFRHKGMGTARMSD